MLGCARSAARAWACSVGSERMACPGEGRQLLAAILPEITLHRLLL